MKGYWWNVYCAYVVVAMYGLFYFGTMVLTLHSNTGDRTLRRMLHHAAEAAGGEEK